VNRLCETTPTPQYAAAPDANILKNLLPECEDSEFWQNFKKAAPIMFCLSVEEDQNLKIARDMSFIEELLKTKSILTLLKQKIEQGGADVDIMEYAIASKMMENKLAILSALNISVEGDGDDKVSFNLFGSNKSIVIDKVKMREAITIQDAPVQERAAQPDDNKSDLTNIETEGLDEEGFLKAAVEAIGEVQKTSQNTLDQKSFIKVFKYTGDFAKFKNQSLKQEAQERRCTHFGTDSAAYFTALKGCIQEEEKAYESSSQQVFDAISITQQCFEKSQQVLMADPYVSMELYNLGISMEQPNKAVPEDLTNERTVELVKASNEYAFDLFKREYADKVMSDPMIMPVLISAIAHDWVKVNHNYDEESFKAALFKHKIYENPEVSQHMQEKQMELMMMAMQNPQMAAQMGGGMPGGMPGMGGF